MSVPAKPLDEVNTILVRILFSANDEVAIQHLRNLSDISYLIGLYHNSKKSEDEERLVLMLLLTIAQHSRTPDRKEEARKALLKLDIVCENDLTYVQHNLCECKGCSKCMCWAYLRKLEQLYEQIDPCINELQSYWVHRNTKCIVHLVKNDNNLSPSCSETMTETFEMFRCTFFMFSFIQLYDGCHSVQYLNKLLAKFIEISMETYNEMNPRLSQLKKGEDGEYQWQEEPQEKYVDSLFLQEHDARHMHIVQILQNKLSASTTNEKQKTMIHEMLGRVEELTTMLHTGVV